MVPPTLQNSFGCSVSLIVDSVNVTGDRVSSFEVKTHRFTLAEWNTHCLFARNSASSRAIPVAKQLKKFLDEPAYPIKWPCEKPGMSGGTELEGRDLHDAVDLWDDWHDMTFDLLHKYVEAHPEPQRRLHKSLLNRLMEPQQWHVMLITAANFENFFDLRVSPNAQPELDACAMLMEELFRRNTPTLLAPGQWHLPYLRENEDVSGTRLSVPSLEVLTGPDWASWDAREISSSRCAATSYETQWTEKSYDKEIERYLGLTQNGHWSPLEHVCTPAEGNEIVATIFDPDEGKIIGTRRVALLGKFVGWAQWRHIVEARQGVNTYR